MGEHIGGLLEWIGLTLLSSVVSNLIPFIIMIHGCWNAKEGKPWGASFFAAVALRALMFWGLVSYASRNGISSSMKIQDLCDGVVFLIMFISMFAYAKGKSKIASANIPQDDEKRLSGTENNQKPDIKHSTTTLSTDNKIQSSRRTDDNMSNIHLSRSFNDLTTYIAKSENEYIKNQITNFNASKELQKKIEAVNPNQVAQIIINQYDSEIDNAQLCDAVQQIKQHACEKISAGQSVNYTDVKIMANKIAQQVILQNRVLTGTENYKAYVEMNEIVNDPVMIAESTSRHIENYQEWEAANINILNIEQNGVPIETIYIKLNRSFGDELFPLGLQEYEMAERIVEIVGKFRNVYENPRNLYLDLATQFAVNDILRSLFATYDTFAFDSADLGSVYDSINKRRAESVKAIGNIHTRFSDADFSITEDYQKDHAIKAKTDDERDSRNTNLSCEEWAATNVVSQETNSADPSKEESLLGKISVGEFSKQLREYKLMLDEGLINQADYENKKSELLNKVR